MWEKFAQLWQIEMRTVPLSLEKTTLDPEEALKMCDENTICIVPIQGVTWTGLNDDVAPLSKPIMPRPATTYLSISTQLRAASSSPSSILTRSGTSASRMCSRSLPRAISSASSIPVSAGWSRRDKKYLPSAMSFSVNYLGAEISQVGSTSHALPHRFSVSTTSLSASDSRATRRCSSTPSPWPSISTLR